MAKKADKVLIALEMSLTQEQAESLSGMLADSDESDSAKIRRVVEESMAEIAKGGMIITADELSKIQQATNIDPTCGEDLLPFLEAGAAMEAGHNVVRVRFDPTVYEGYRQHAEIQGREVEDLFQEVIDKAIDEEWMYSMEPRPHRILMTPEDHNSLEEVLGEKFEDGTKLAGMIRRVLGVEDFLDVAPAKEPSAEEVKS